MLLYRSSSSDPSACHGASPRRQPSAPRRHLSITASPRQACRCIGLGDSTDPAIHGTLRNPFLTDQPDPAAHTPTPPPQPDPQMPRRPRSPPQPPDTTTNMTTTPSHQPPRKSKRHTSRFRRRNRAGSNSGSSPAVDRDSVVIGSAAGRRAPPTQSAVRRALRELHRRRAEHVFGADRHSGRRLVLRDLIRERRSRRPRPLCRCEIPCENAAQRTLVPRPRAPPSGERPPRSIPLRVPRPVGASPRRTRCHAR